MRKSELNQVINENNSEKEVINLNTNSTTKKICCLASFILTNIISFSVGYYVKKILDNNENLDSNSYSF